MMQEPKLTYNQLRSILGLAVSNDKIKATLADFLAGKVTEVSQTELIELVYESGIDIDLISILSGKVLDEINELDAMDGVEYIYSFFDYIRVNKAKFSGWLESSGLKVVALPSTGTKASK